MPRHDPPLQAEREVVWELGELRGWVHAHAVGEELELGREVGLDTIGENGGGAANNGADGAVWEPRGFAKEEELGEECAVDGESEEQGSSERKGSPSQGNAVAKEVKRGAEGVRDGRGEEARGTDHRGAEERRG